MCAALALSLIQRVVRFFVARSRRRDPERRGSLLTAPIVLIAVVKG